MFSYTDILSLVMISMAEVHRVIENGELVEDYPEGINLVF